MTDDSPSDSGLSGAGAGRRTAISARVRAAAPWLALALLAGWTRELSPWWLVGASALVLARLLARPGLRPAAILGLFVALAAVASGFQAHRQLRRLTHDWDAWWGAREAEVFRELDERLGRLLDRGEGAVQDLVLLVEESEGRPPLASVEALRREAGVGAVVVYGPDGEPVVWAGTHRGRIPEDVQLGIDPYAYGELPLFSHLYFTAPIRATGGTAVVAELLRSELPPDLDAEPGDLVSRFHEATGEELRITTAERASDPAVYDFGWEDQTLFSISVVRPAQAERLRDVRSDWIRLVVGLLAGAWLLLAVAAARERRGALFAAATLALLLAVLPWPLLLDAPELFSAADFLLPSPGTVTLGRLLAIALAGAVVAGLLPLAGRGPLPGAAAAVVGLGFPLFVSLVGEAPTVDFLAGSERDWVIYQATLAAILALVALAGLGLDRRDGSERWTEALAAACAVTGALAVWAAWLVRSGAELPAWAAAAWAVPAFLVLPALRAAPPRRRPLLVWVAAGVLGASAALPWAWAHRVEARMAMAEVQLSRLGAAVDPYLEDLLLPRLGATLDSLHREGAGAMELLYRMASGLAEEGYPVWATHWTPGGIPGANLSIGVGDMPPMALASEGLEEVRRGGEVEVRRLSDPSAHYVVQVPLSDQSVITGVIPPAQGSAAFSPLAYLFEGSSAGRPEPLELVPLIPGDELRAGATPRWVRTAEGLRAEVGLVFPPGAEESGGGAQAMVHAQYRVDLAGAPILVARATLLLALNLALLLAFWGAGRGFVAGPRPAGARSGVLTSFRARVTLALFGFFLLSNAIFGTLAYRNIAGAAERAAEVLAERIAQDAAELYLEVSRMEQLAGRVGGDLLEYRGGQLTSGAAEEPVELGLYEGLVPFEVYSDLRSGSGLVETRGESLGRWEYVTAYRRLADGAVLAVPVPLQAGATAVRRREVADLLLFAIVAGAALSFALALLVGRTLTRPIRTLQVASERVGSGNLGVRLRAERSDEFGAVFSAFNRMVRRLRRARGDLVRTTRRTRAIVDDAATGVIALDGHARVTLVNPRAEALLGHPVAVGRRLAADGGPGAELVRWVERYFRDRLLEATSEFQSGERRIRVRARRITRGEGATDGTADTMHGAVLSLEDVTDELRAERVLAWGEMARQVAHEVKNPLTPIKLSIQHIQRARSDRRADFDEILSRNADAMLKEIDRLAAIASSFSRFGAPTEAGVAPLEAVRVGKVAADVLALYTTGDGPIRFSLDAPTDLAPVWARESELKEVLVNLLENARAAIEAQGGVRVEVRRADDSVVLSVVDDGSGIPSEVLPRVFEPHFSTRSGGTGLGLAIVRRLVESWDAAVSVESEPGRGTAVHIWFRAWHGEAPGTNGPG